MDWAFDWSLPFNYGTVYKAGVGPYDSDYVLLEMTDEYHFEELGVELEGILFASLGVAIGGTAPDRLWAFTWELNLELFRVKPFILTFWVSRRLANWYENGKVPQDFEMHISATRDMSPTYAYLSYLESAAYAGSEIR